MKILAIADKKPDVLLELLEQNSFNTIITLWDLYKDEISELQSINIPKVGVFWNHCNIYQDNYMEELWITNLHLKTTRIWNLVFGWFEWCVKYKEQEHFMYTQEEANTLIQQLPKVDVLVTHSPPLWINDNEDPAHIWFEAIKNYINQYSPKYLFHWHSYDDGTFVNKYKNTEIIYVNGTKIIYI